MSELAILKKLCDAGPTLDFAKLGNCRGMDPNDFYPYKGDPVPVEVCETCPMRLECLAWGLCHERYGFWGGVSERNRKKLRQQLRVSCAAPEVHVDDTPACGTAAGARRHYLSGERPCELCRVAKNAYQLERKHKRQRRAVA